MSWATAATLVGAGAFLALILVISYIIYNQGKKIGIQQGKEDECKKVDNATKDLATHMYDTTDDDFIVLHKDGWRKPDTKT